MFSIAPLRSPLFSMLPSLEENRMNVVNPACGTPDREKIHLNQKIVQACYRRHKLGIKIGQFVSNYVHVHACVHVHVFHSVCVSL